MLILIDGRYSNFKRFISNHTIWLHDGGNFDLMTSNPIILDHLRMERFLKHYLLDYFLNEHQLSNSKQTFKTDSI